MNTQMALIGAEPVSTTLPQTGSLELGQFPTARWAADMIVRTCYPDLGPGSKVLEPSCAYGAFLQALPAGVEAVGVEIDPALVIEARKHVPFEIIEGDFCQVDLPEDFDLVLGNPPFKMALVDQFLERSHRLLVKDGEVGFILPAYAFQTADRVCRYNQDWSLEVQSIPRNLYPGLKHPLVWSRFRKDGKQTLVGLFLYQETADVHKLPKRYRRLFCEQSAAPLWPLVVENALVSLGGEARLSAIYAEIEGNRPTQTKFWREQVRKVLNQYFRRTEAGCYSLQLKH